MSQTKPITPPYILSTFPAIPKEAMRYSLSPASERIVFPVDCTCLHIHTSHNIELRPTKETGIRLQFKQCEGVVDIFRHGEHIYVLDILDNAHTNRKLVVYAPFQMPYIGLSLCGKAHLESDLRPHMVNICAFDEATANFCTRNLFLQSGSKADIHAHMSPHSDASGRTGYTGDAVIIANGGSTELSGNYNAGGFVVCDGAEIHHDALALTKIDLFLPEKKGAAEVTPSLDRSGWFDASHHKKVTEHPLPAPNGPDIQMRALSMNGMIQSIFNR